ncbi:MAG: DUF4232 domain-containing protein [Acidimicrobiales bacterium]
MATCTSDDVTPSVGGSDYLGSGEDIDAVLLTNSSQSACSIGGYPTISFFSAAGTTDLDASYEPAGNALDIPSTFQQVDPSTVTDLDPGQSAAIYYYYNSRVASNNCVVQDAGLDISWTGSDSSVRFPTVAGLVTIEACDGTDVTFSQIGPAPTRLFVADR